MELQLEECKHLSMELENYEMLCACACDQQIAVVWYQKNQHDYAYIIKKYDEDFKEIASCEFHKKLRYDLIRMYRNICILVNLEGGKANGYLKKNVLLITADGIQLKEFPIGMGLSNVSISPQGTIWCGYDNNGSYKEYIPTVSKGISCMLAAWNFFGELVYEMEYPLYDENYGFFHDCSSVYAKDNQEIYFFYYDQSDLCLLKNMKDRNLIPFQNDHKRPFDFTIQKDKCFVYFEPYVEELKSLEYYQLLNHHLIYKDVISFFYKQQKIYDYRLFMNENVLLVQYENRLYYYAL